MSSVAAPLSVERAWQALRAVPDPEIPVVSVVELGIVRDVALDTDALADGVPASGALVVTLTPTYCGCPATEAIAAAIEAALHEAGAGPVRLVMRLAPPWTTDWIEPAARDKLRAYGIVPPAAPRAGAAGEQPLRLLARAAIDCPRCGSSDTERLAQFGATACKALYRCRACREPFEYFKPL